MTSIPKNVLEEALSLSDDERAELVEALTDSLEPKHEQLSPEWEAELARRIEAVERGESHLVPGREVEARIQEALRKA